MTEITKSYLAKHYRRLSLVWITLLTLTVGAVTTFSMAKAMIERDLNLSGQLIAAYLEQHLISGLFTESQIPSQTDLNDAFWDLKNLMRVEHVKYFSPTGEIIWSDIPDFIGQHEELDTTLENAQKGELQAHYELLEHAPLLARNRTDTDWDLPLLYEIYIPIRTDTGSVFGVAEIYQKPEVILGALTSGLLTLWSILFFAGGLYFFLSNRLFVNASNTLLKLTSDLDRSYRLAAIGQCVSMIVHDTRNLLACIKFACKRLGDPHVTCEERMQLVKDVGKPLEMSFEMMNDMLDFVSGKHVSLVCEHHNVRTIVEDSCLILGSVLTTSRHKLTITAPEDLTIYCDSQKLLHILINLIRNSSQSMIKSGEIIISAVEIPGGVKLIIQDSGEGIPEDVLSEIFEPFVSDPNKNRPGLGLAIIRGLMQRHGGSITASNRAEGGAEFTMFFPNGPAPESAPSEDAVLAAESIH